jgi:diadenosine tetraphosphate (Ap4A) HIT family hydrolase
MNTCITCQLIAQRDTGDAPLWDNIHRAQYWDLVHCNSTSLLGWLVLVARRHVGAIDEMTDEEVVEFGQMMRWTSIILKDLTGCLRTYVVQFAEAPGHQHVHFHIVPRLADLPDADRGPAIFRHLGVPPEDRQTEAAMNAFAQQVQSRLYDLLQTAEE